MKLAAANAGAQLQQLLLLMAQQPLDEEKKAGQTDALIRHWMRSA